MKKYLYWKASFVRSPTLPFILIISLGGYEPLVYYSFNLLIHITCSWLVCRFCSKVMGFDILYAWIAGLLFLFYPFHNEAIVWAVGRGVSMATVFALAALVVAFSSLSINWKYLLVCIFYFVGLTAYETICLGCARAYGKHDRHQQRSSQ